MYKKVPENGLSILDSKLLQHWRPLAVGWVASDSIRRESRRSRPHRMFWFFVIELVFPFRRHVRRHLTRLSVESGRESRIPLGEVRSGDKLK